MTADTTAGTDVVDAVPGRVRGRVIGPHDTDANDANDAGAMFTGRSD